MIVPYAEVIGDPVGHSLSPVIHRFWLGKLGLDYDYRATRVPLEALGDFLAERRHDPDWCGANVTMPLKIAAAGLVDELSPQATDVGAINCIVRRGSSEPRLVGQNSDLLAVRELLQSWTAPDDHAFAHLLGTGGAAAAAAYVLSRHTNDPIVFVYGRTRESAASFATRYGIHDEDDAFDFGLSIDSLANGGPPSDVPRLLVNATPLGMRGQDPLEIKLDFLQPGSTVFDMVYDPVETSLLRAARERGFTTIDGLQMLVAQAAHAFELFFSEPAPREHDAELRALLTA